MGVVQEGEHTHIKKENVKNEKQLEFTINDEKKYISSYKKKNEHSHKHMKNHNHIHSNESTKNISNRLARAAGHLEFVRKMVKDERDCIEILNQITAVTSALNSTSRIILQEHIEQCVTDAIKSKDRSIVEDLNTLLTKLIK